LVSEQELHLYISGEAEGKIRQVVGDSGDCLQVGNNQEDSQEDCRRSWDTQVCRVTATGFLGEQTGTTTWLLKAIDMLEGKT
jgi:hypothetical protein